MDVTSIGLGRDPQALMQVANSTGLNIVMGGGYYIKSLHPPDMDQRTVEELTQGLIRDVTLGAARNKHPLGSHRRGWRRWKSIK